MEKISKILILSLISISALSWSISKDQSDMMMAMMSYDPLAITLFTLIWTAGMTAMMFPAITPMVLLYYKLVTSHVASSSVIEKKSYSLKMILFVSSYLAIWSMTGLALLFGWSIPINYLQPQFEANQLQILFGILLIISGAYQFSSLKTKCLVYCESPLSFFGRRWRNGIVGAIKMGAYHGLYCLGCCWPYFLLMVALGWMNLIWMGLFALIIFGEKIWSKGIWVARLAGLAFIIVGLIRIVGTM